MSAVVPAASHSAAATYHADTEPGGSGDRLKAAVDGNEHASV